MIPFIIWFAAFFCPNPSHTIDNHGNCTLIHSNGGATTNFGEGGDDGGDDTGGETGGHPHPHVPPPPPPPPHP